MNKQGKAQEGRVKQFNRSEAVRHEMRKRLDIADQEVLVYSGTIGTLSGIDRMVDCVQTYDRAFQDAAYLLLLTHSDERFWRPFVDRIDIEWQHHSVTPEDMPRYLNAGDWALMTFADSPISDTILPCKFSEYLAMCLPILTHPDDKTSTKTIKQYDVGEILRTDVTPEKLRERLEDCKWEWQCNCHFVAHQYFSLDAAVEQYSRIYEGLTKGDK